MHLVHSLQLQMKFHNTVSKGSMSALICCFHCPPEVVWCGCNHCHSDYTSLTLTGASPIKAVVFMYCLLWRSIFLLRSEYPSECTSYPLHPNPHLLHPPPPPPLLCLAVLTLIVRSSLIKVRTSACASDFLKRDKPEDSESSSESVISLTSLISSCHLPCSLPSLCLSLAFPLRSTSPAEQPLS